MIFIANVLVMNGGSTFIMRMARAQKKRGRTCAVILLRNVVDEALLERLEQDAEVFRLSDFQRDGGKLARGLLGVFAPIDWAKLTRAIAPFADHVHAMSVFGMILGLRMVAANCARRLTIGIYHQNEFLFRAGRSFFERTVQRLFAEMPARNLIFFNESSRNNYGDFFRQDYGGASLLPIGVVLDQPPAPREDAPGPRIVSIGNLVGFKTYNRHMIDMVAALRHDFPEISYDIYGSGPMERELADHAREIGVEDAVTFHGNLDYARFRDVVAPCDLFVGSGTALIEAAAIGRPALIGVESLETPETYGFLCDADGFSYNELVDGAVLHPIEGLVRKLFADREHWLEIAAKCERKAQEFSIDVTIDGFEEAGTAALADVPRVTAPMLARLAASAITLKIAELVAPSKSFGSRRNQSY